MIRNSELAPLRDTVRARRLDGARIGFVPTMGNLHAGHMALVDHARRHADFVVVSIYVNPLQFSAGEDFSTYPRTMDADSAALGAAGVDLLFAPGDSLMYPRGMDDQTKVEVPGLSDILCGAGRPGHFRGVSTVVTRLFNMVLPDLAVFGKKDYQQLLVIRRMVEDLAMPVEIAGVDTVREPDGLAMSSRNQYLQLEQRRIAPELYKSIIQARSKITSKSAKLEEICDNSMQSLAKTGFAPEYFEIRRRGDLRPPAASDHELVILAAARLGAARLIDNVELDV